MKYTTALASQPRAIHTAPPPEMVVHALVARALHTIKEAMPRVMAWARRNDPSYSAIPFTLHQTVLDLLKLDIWNATADQLADPSKLASARQAFRTLHLVCDALEGIIRTRTAAQPCKEVAHRPHGPVLLVAAMAQISGLVERSIQLE